MNRSQIEFLFSKNNLLKLILFCSAVALSVEKFLLAMGSAGLCTTRGCQVVGEYVRFGEPFLIFVGASFFWIMWLAAFFADRYSKDLFWHFLQWCMLGAMAFDGALLGYQFMGIRTLCLLCLGVGAALFLSASCLAWVRRSWVFVMCCLAVWMGSFLGNSVLKFRSELPGYKDITLVQRSAEREMASLDLYLIFSLHCAHCSELVSNLAINRPWAANWHLVAIDSKREDLLQLSALVNDPQLKANPFLALLKVEANADKLVQTEILPQVRQAVDNARDFFIGRGYRAVPMLIAREGPDREYVLTGEDAISEYLWDKGLISRWIDVSRLRKEKNDK